MHASDTHDENQQILGATQRVAALRRCLDLTYVKRIPYLLRDRDAGLRAAVLPAQTHTAIARNTACWPVLPVSHRRRTLQNMPSASGELA